MITEQDLNELGFKRIPQFTVNDTFVFDLGRRRCLSLGCFATPNETLFICEKDEEDERRITDLICIHNWDYDGYITKEKITTLINVLK